MAESSGSRLTALSGLLYVVLVFVGSAAIAGTRGPGRHSLDQSAEDVADYLADADHARVWLGEYIGALGFLLFLPFSAYVIAAVARRGDDVGSWRTLAHTAAGIYVALSLAGVAALAPALNREGEAAAGFLDLRTSLIAVAFVVLGVWLLAVGTEALRSRALAAWLAWAAVVIGLLLMIATPLAAYDPSFTGLPTFASFLWVLIVSVLLVRRERLIPGP